MKRGAAFLVCLLLLSGCIGTGTTRQYGDDGRRPFGSYPFAGVVVDCELVGMQRNPNDMTGLSTLAPVIGIISLPVDIVIDAVLAPLDLIAWPFGWRKNGKI